MLESCVVRWPPLAPLGTIDVGVMCCLAESSFNVEGTNSDEGDASVEDFFSFLPPSLHMHYLKGCVCVCVCVCVYALLLNRYRCCCLVVVVVLKA